MKKEKLIKVINKIKDANKKKSNAKTLAIALLCAEAMEIAVDIQE